VCGEVGSVYHLRLCIHQHSFAEKREGLSVSDPISSRTEFLSSTEYPGSGVLFVSPLQSILLVLDMFGPMQGFRRTRPPARSRAHD